ncbi:NAD(P)-dependent oxidoreductase [Streptacidiphilus sp. PAMC 29251]
MSTIVVLGISGYAGGHIADELLARGHHVVGVARNPDKVTPREHLEVRSGSIYDTRFLTATAAGADAIVVATVPRQDDGQELAAAVPALLAAAGGGRLGVVGGAASLRVSEGGPLVIDADFPQEYRADAEAHARLLDALKEADTGVDWFYLSPAGSFGSYNPGTRTGTFRLGTDVLVTDADGNSNISGADFATAFADELEKPAHHQARFTMGY